MFRLLAVTAALVLGASPSHSTMAGKWYTHNLCEAKTMQGATATFRCKLNQKCCFNQLTGHRSYFPITAICF